jgi:sigma-E factor negative regulatory protein RseA
MAEDLNPKISQFLDNELDHVNALSLLRKIQMQSELQDKLNRYEAISHAIKTDVFLLTQPDLATKIHQQIQKEPHYLLPQQRFQKEPLKSNHKHIAVAASLALVAVIAGSNVNRTDQHSKAASVIQVAQQQLPKQPSNPVVYANKTEHYPLNKRINDYLQAHNSSVYTNGEANFQPFARVTAYSQK